MITFGGRPLNTYKGETNKPNVDKVNPNSVTNNGPEFVDVNPKIVTVNGPGLFDPPNSVIDVNANRLIIDPPNSVIDVNANRLIIDSPNSVIDVKPNGLIIEPPNSVVNNPGLFDQTKSPENEPSEINKIISGGNSKTLLKLHAALDNAKFKSRFAVKLLGAPIVIFFIYLWLLCGYFWNLIIFMIIFSICYFLYEITQGILNASHSLLDGVSKALTSMNDAAISFHIPGIFRFRQQLFGNAFEPWIRDVDRSNNNFPRKASDLVINVLTEMLKSIVKSLPGIIDGIANGASRVFSSK